jgi:hypothetical protein
VTRNVHAIMHCTKSILNLPGEMHAKACVCILLRLALQTRSTFNTKPVLAMWRSAAQLRRMAIKMPGETASSWYAGILMPRSATA